jgi:hypothetical protein
MMRTMTIVVVTLSALTAMTLVLVATHSGIGVSPDSVAYLTGAHSLAGGHGYSDDTDGHYFAITKFPPLFPFVLSIGERGGLSGTGAARALHVILFPLLVVLTAMIVWRICEDGIATSAAAAIVATSPVFVRSFANAWSEPLFLVITALAILLLHKALGDARWMPGAAAVAGLAALDRYAGIALIGIAALAILLTSRGRGIRRLWPAALFGLIASIPLSLWVIRNLTLAGNATERPLARHLINRGQLEAGGATLWSYVTNACSWKLLDRIPHNLQYATAALLSVAVLCHLIAWSRTLPDERRQLLYVVMMFAVGYPAFIVTSISIADASTGLDFRILSPLLIAGVILASISIVVLLGRFSIVPIVLFVIIGLTGSIVWAETAGRDGIDYNSNAWRHSALMTRVRTLPADVAICTNATDGVHFLTGRPSVSLPYRFHPLTGVPDPHYLEKLRTWIARPGGRRVVAFFDTQSWRSYYPTHSEIASLPCVREIDAEADGVLFAPCDQPPLR